MNEQINQEIKENYLSVLESIGIACKKADRSPDQVTLIAVSKTKPVEMLQQIYDCGCRHFGENKVQELVDKYEKLPKDIHWHMIGHLQRNKVKYIIDKVDFIHGVDSFELAQEISRQAIKHNRTVNILIEINVADEESKFGVSFNDAETLVLQISTLENISIRGFMTVAPYVDNSEENRQHFVKLKQLSVDIKNKNIDNTCIDVLSMGMTNDYKIAISEGATFVRVGTGVFGERNYSM